VPDGFVEREDSTTRSGRATRIRPTTSWSIPRAAILIAFSIANAIRLAARGVEHDVVGRLAARFPERRAATAV
jgi:hypothetical protein